MFEFFANCDFRKVHEFLLYFGGATAIIAFFFAALLHIGKKYEGLKKQLLANLSAVIPVGLMFFLLWLVDENMLLSKACTEARVDTVSMLVWAVALVAALVLNFQFFGRRLRIRGFYLK